MDIDLEKDLFSNKLISNKCKSNPKYAQNLYAALCNNIFWHGDKKWSCSWRHSGGIVSELVGSDGGYLDYYCSGMASNSSNGFVPESVVTEEIRSDLLNIGWVIKPYE